MKSYDYEEIKHIVVQTIREFENSDKTTFLKTFRNELIKNLVKAKIIEKDDSEKDLLRLKGICDKILREFIKETEA